MARAWLVAALSLVHCASGQLEGLIQLLSDIPYTCPMPMEEDAALNETVAGRALLEMSFLAMQEVPKAVEETLPGACKQLVEELLQIVDQETPVPVSKIPKMNERLRARCVKVMKERTANETQEKMMDCSPDALLLCNSVPVGSFCPQVLKHTGEGADEQESLCVLKKPAEEKALEHPCPAGMYCEGGPASPRVCAKGFHCPKGSGRAQKCEPGHVCVLSAIAFNCSGEERDIFTGASCIPDDKGRVILPLACAPGQYCSNGINQPCPKGQFCPVGSSKPIKCEPMEICPAGGSMPHRYPRALLQNAGWIALACLIAFVLTANLSTGRLRVAVAAYLLGLVTMWCYEAFFSATTITTHLTFITYYTWVIFWGVLSAEKLAMVRVRFGIMAQLAMDFTASLLPVFASWLFYRDGCSAAFLAILWPSILVIYKVLVDSATDLLVEILLVFAVIAFLVFVPFFAGVHESSNLVAILVLLALIILPEAARFLVGQLMATREERAQVDKLAQAIQADQEQARVRPSAGPRRTSVLAAWSAVPRPASAQPAAPEKRKSSAREIELVPTVPLMCEAANGAATAADDVAHVEAPPEPDAAQDDATPPSTWGKPPAVGITLRGMHLFLPNGETILHNVTLTIPAGSTVAVMGPSGSGKSSITNVLSGRAGYGIVTGRIAINGSEELSLQQLRPVTGFVPQDDVMHRNLTCVENVACQAKLRLPLALRTESDGDWAHEEAQKMLKLIGLAHVSDSLIGDESTRGISGGQRKRVSIAMEFVARPAILFLDEPTSGLDSTTSHSVIELVTKNAKATDCTTAAVIHQPRYETFLLFDYCFLLAAGGYLAYAGLTKDVIKFFSEELGVEFPPLANPADVFMDAITLDSARLLFAKGKMKTSEDDLKDRNTFGQFLAAVWEGARDRYGAPEELATERLLPELSPVGCTWGEAMVAQMRRGAMQLRREVRQHLAIQSMLVAGTVALIFGLSTSGDLGNVLLQPAFALFFLMMTQGVVAQRVFGGPERFVAWREAGIGSNMILYFIGRDLVSLLEVLTGTAVFTATYWSMGPLLCDLHTVFWVTFSFNYAVFGLSFIWSIIFPPSTAQMLSVVAAFLSFLTSGLQPNFRSLISIGYGEMMYVMSLSPVRWAHGYLIWDHIQNSHGSQFESPLIFTFSQGKLNDLAMPLAWINRTKWSCDKPGTVAERWVGTAGLHPDDPGYRPPNSFVCSTGQLFLIGLYFRFVAVVSLVAMSKIQATGGGAVIEGPGSRSKALSPVFNKIFIGFMVALTSFESGMLLGTF